MALSRSSCLNYLHRLGFVLKRPKKRLLKADPARREAFVSEYVALTGAARRSGAKIFFADEAHFQADADLRGKWVLKGEPALVDTTSPRRGEKVSYYSAGVPGDWRGGGDGTGRQQQLRHLNRFPAATARPAHRTADRDLGQLPSPSGRRATDLLDHARLEPAPGELAQLQSGFQTPTKLSGAGCARRQPPMCAWEPVPQYEKGSTTFSPIWTTAGKK